MKKLLNFLSKLESQSIHYHLEHNRDDFVMVHVALPGERWEVEFSANNEVEIEIFKNSEGVFTDESLLEEIFAINNGCELTLHLSLIETADEDTFLDRFIEEAIEVNHLAVGGNPLHKNGCTISFYERGTVTKNLQQIVKNWVAQQPQVRDYQLGDLIENKN